MMRKFSSREYSIPKKWSRDLWHPTKRIKRVIIIQTIFLRLGGSESSIGIGERLRPHCSHGSPIPIGITSHM